MKKLLFLSFIALICSGSLVQAELPEYDVRRTTEKIVIDGIADEADWAAAEPIHYVFPWFTEGEKEGTEVRILWDDEFLYLNYRCDDKWIWADIYNTNDTTYKDDCVELFWDPNPADTSRRKYNMFEISCIGNLLSVFVGSGVSIHERVSRTLPPHIAQTIDGTVNDDSDIDTGWVLEVAVRFEDYTDLYDGSTPKDGDMWRIGLNRLGGKTNPQSSMWSPSQTEKSNFHRPEDFGKIYFRDIPVR